MLEIQHGSTEDREYIREQLIGFNKTKVPLAVQHETEQICFLLKEGGEIKGGLTGEYSWNHVHVSFLWLDESVKGGGYGSKLLSMVEAYANERACSKVILDTFSFQAPGFYEKNGYVEYGRLDDHPVEGMTQYFYKKLL
ncbi:MULTISPECIES: GNAT family N-acetyltransferase [unclassified Exiguobacterium]|uniref:GNAT family N-acetyltransferase n=1 Tax=unclassified Exiguobacterium TaxID=2644629 RepID=UPI001BE950DB|nr:MULTISPECIES: GNAT family N-acetyltransferase [unclassified Exiguobacterium]